MAILMQEHAKPINWFAILIVVLIVAVMGFGSYYLFFAPTPGIEIVLPSELKSAGQIYSIEVDPSVVVNSRAFRALRSYAGLLGVGELGRDNPFLPF